MEYIGLLLFIGLLVLALGYKQYKKKDEGEKPSKPRASKPSANNHPDEFVGLYYFYTPNDRKNHFRIEVRSGGSVFYHLNGGPSGSWSISGGKFVLDDLVDHDRSRRRMEFFIKDRSGGKVKMMSSSLRGREVQMRRK